MGWELGTLLGRLVRQHLLVPPQVFHLLHRESRRLPVAREVKALLSECMHPGGETDQDRCNPDAQDDTQSRHTHVWFDRASRCWVGRRIQCPLGLNPVHDTGETWVCLRNSCSRTWDGGVGQKSVHQRHWGYPRMGSHAFCVSPFLCDSL